MRPAETPVLRDIVLVGGGHSHAVVLRMFAMHPLPGVRLTVICTDTDTPYSGMVPGYVAGHYAYDDVHIDLRRLAACAGARFFLAEVTGIDRALRKVLCRERPPIPYDLLSINVGSTPRVNEVAGAGEFCIPVKPIRRFNERWLAMLDRVRGRAGPTTIAVVGAGAGGVELTLAMQRRLLAEARARDRAGEGPDAGREIRFHLFSAESTILPTHNRAVQASFLRTLARRGVTVHLDSPIEEVARGELRVRGGAKFSCDEILWATQAGAAAWLRDTGLALDAGGFVRVRATLQTETDPAIFAAGDCASFVERPLEKAGVFAVRMGPPLYRNLRRALQHQPLLAYRPQRRWLSLISTGDRNAVASRGMLHASGLWVWRWKDAIDRRFMRRFRDLSPAMSAQAAASPAAIALEEAEQTQAISALAMRCGGCGAKVGATVLSRALAGVHPIEREEVPVGLHAPDDAAVVRVPQGKALVQTVDFFRSFIDDPYVFGRIAANHALGDVFAMGGEAFSATAIATVPPGLESKVEDTLFQMMTGAVEVLNEAGCALVGGHTGEGGELALGFAITGLIQESLAGLLTKGGMRPGDALILTKPIGTGTLLAAHARARARGRWVDGALASMQASNRAAASILQSHGATACTDLTGFGLLGHLVEMTRPSGVDARIDLDALPLLPGAAETAAAGILSSLQPANVRLRRALRDPGAALRHPNYPLLFDPQTAGGLLASIPADRADAAIESLRAAGYAAAVRIGEVLAAQPDLPPICLKMRGIRIARLIEPRRAPVLRVRKRAFRG